MIPPPTIAMSYVTRPPRGSIRRRGAAGHAGMRVRAGPVKPDQPGGASPRNPAHGKGARAAAVPLARYSPPSSLPDPRRRMPTALVLSFSDLRTDPRVSRQIRWLAGEYAVTAAGLAPPDESGVRFLPIGAADQSSATSRALRGLRLLSRFHESAYWSAYGDAFEALQSERPNLIVANDLDTLPLAIRLGETSRAPVIFDAHEYAPGEFDDSWKWRLLRQPYAAALCRRYVPKAAAVTTVCEAIAAAYAGLTGVRPEVITNAPEYHADLLPRPTADHLRLIHHGAAIPARKIENMVRMTPLLDRRFEFNFMLVDGVRSYREE